MTREQEKAMCVQIAAAHLPADATIEQILQQAQNLFNFIINPNQNENFLGSNSYYIRYHWNNKSYHLFQGKKRKNGFGK